MKKYWLRGGMIGLISGIIIFLLIFLLAPLGCIAMVGADCDPTLMEKLIANYNSLKNVSFSSNQAIFLLITTVFGMMCGVIYGKFKN